MQAGLVLPDEGIECRRLTVPCSYAPPPPGPRPPGLTHPYMTTPPQVSQLMSADRDKLIARSQLPLQLAPRPLGQPAAAGEAAAADGADGAGGGPSSISISSSRGGDRARDPETYDEGDFYAQLLKELLESGEGPMRSSRRAPTCRAAPT